MASKWQHPTGKVPDTVMLVAHGPSKGDWIQDRISMNPVLKYDELWTLNAGCDYVANIDLLWYMDDLMEQCQRYPGTAAKLKKVHVPVITTTVYDKLDIPGKQYAYPLAEIINHVGGHNDYFINSVPYIIAYAQFIGVKRLIMAGVDYHFPGLEARENGRGCCEFWIGWSTAKGMLVQVTQGSTLLNASQGRPFYGYLRQPIIHYAEESVELEKDPPREFKGDGQEVPRETYTPPKQIAEYPETLK